MILKPLKFSGQVNRLLSGWCKEVPAVDVGADLEALEVTVAANSTVISHQKLPEIGKTVSFFYLCLFVHLILISVK